MTDSLARTLFGVCGFIFLAGVGLVDHNFDPNDPWFFIGLLLILMGVTLANAVAREWHTRTLDDEYDAGYRVGYRAGRRASLTVTRPTPGKRVNTDPIPLRRRATAEHKRTNGLETWPDSESSRQGSTRRR